MAANSVSHGWEVRDVRFWWPNFHAAVASWVTTGAGETKHRKEGKRVKRTGFTRNRQTQRRKVRLHLV